MTTLKGQRGFTLLEMIFTIGVTGVLVSLAVVSMFQAWGTEGRQKQEMVASMQLRNAQRWFASDAINAASTSLQDGGAPESGLSLDFTDADGVPHTVSYGLDGDRLVRTIDGVSVTIARDVTSATFSRSGNTVFLTLEVDAAQLGTRSLTLRTYMRMATST